MTEDELSELAQRLEMSDPYGDAIDANEIRALIAEVRRLRSALARIEKLDPEIESKEGWNEWGQADCFGLALKIARETLSPAPSKSG